MASGNDSDENNNFYAHWNPYSSGESDFEGFDIDDVPPDAPNRPTFRIDQSINDRENAQDVIFGWSREDSPPTVAPFTGTPGLTVELPDDPTFQLNGSRFKKHMQRTKFKFSTEFTRKTSLEKCTSNVDFIKVLEEEGVDRISSKKRTTVSTARNREWPEESGSIGAELTSKDTELSILQTHYAGKFSVPARRLKPGDTDYSVRELSQSWVLDIKKNLLETPSPVITTLPALLDPTKVTSIDAFTTDMLANDAIELILLGGNHVTTAVQQIMMEERDNEVFACLREIDIHLYVGLNMTEAHFVSSLHNMKCKTRSTTFQDKVKLCRQVYNLDRQEENWKNVAAVSLGHLCGQKVTKDSISPILSCASYTTQNYKLLQEIFYSYEIKNPDSSFPQQLFKNLLSLSSESRQPYLSRAIGTNGLCQARKVNKDRGLENLKNLFVKEMELDSWEEAEQLYSDEVIELVHFAVDMETTPKKIPTRVLDFIRKVKEGEHDRTEDIITIDISIKINGKEVQQQKKFERLIQQHKKKLKYEVGKLKCPEE